MEHSESTAPISTGVGAIHLYTEVVWREKIQPLAFSARLHGHDKVRFHAHDSPASSPSHPRVIPASPRVIPA